MFENFVAHGFLVEDVDRAAAWYMDRMGYRADRRTPTFVRLETVSQAGLFLWQYAHIAAHLGAAFKEVRHRSMSAIRYERREEVRRACDALAGQGVRMVAPPREWEWDAYAAYFVDDDGYLWELWTWNKA